MKMMKMKTLILKFAIIIAVIGVFWFPSVSVLGETLNYQVTTPEYFIATKALVEGTDLFSGYYKSRVLSDQMNHNFNAIGSFTENDINFETVKSDYNATYERKISDMDPVLGSLLKSKQLQFRLSATFTNSVPSFYERNFKRDFRMGVMMINVGINDTMQYLQYFTPYNDDADHRVGDDDLIVVKDDNLRIDFNKVSNRDGAKVKKTLLMFADTTPPAISGIKFTATSDLNDQNRYRFATENPIYIQVSFTENIRFSDANQSPHDIKLNLKVKEKSGSGEVLKANQTADLVSLHDNIMIFKYDVPSYILNNEGQQIQTNHMISGFDGMTDMKDNKNILFTKQGFSLAMNYNYLPYLKEFWGYEFKSDSLITDLAGNPLNPTSLSDPALPINIDTVAPIVTDVTLNTNYAKNSYLGPERYVIPTINFSEPLYFKIGQNITPYSAYLLKATLNVKDSQGNNVVVTGAQSVGAPNEKTKAFSFKPFVIKDGMYIESGDDCIKVKSLDFTDSNYKPCDACGNLLATGLLYYKTTNTPTNPVVLNGFFKIDVDKPTVTLNTPKNGDVYLPTMYASGGNGTNLDSFYFSYSISDKTSGVVPLGTDMLKATFSFTGSDGAIKPTYKFKYAVTTSPNPPDATLFNEAYLGQNVYIQQANDLYMHINVTDLNAYYSSYKIFLKAYDLVANNTPDEYNLQGTQILSCADHILPTITTDSTNTYYNSTDKKWYFSGDFTLSDGSNIDTSTVYYQWVDKGATPDDNAWLNCTGLGASDTTIKMTLSHQLTDNAMNNLDLYIKASDSSSNHNLKIVGPINFKRDISKVAYQYNAPLSVVANPQLSFKMEQQSVDGVDKKGYFAIAYFFIKEAQGYSLYQPPGQSIDTVNLFKEPIGAVGWTVVKGGIAERMLNNSYYGEATVKMVVGYGLTYSFADDGSLVISNPSGIDYSEENFTLKVAPDIGTLHIIKFDCLSMGSQSTSQYRPDYGAKSFKGFEGASFNISITNYVYNSWTTEDIDFENTYFAMCRENGGNPIKVYTVPIGINANVKIPDSDITYVNDYYYFEVVVTSKASKKVERQVIKRLTGSDYNIDIRVDISDVEDFGLSQTTTNYSFQDPYNGKSMGDIVKTDTQWYGYDGVNNPMTDVSQKTYSNPQILKLGIPAVRTDVYTESDMTHKLYFTTLSNNDGMYIRVWNKTFTNYNYSGTIPSARWLPISNTGSNPFVVKFVDNSSGVPYSLPLYTLPLLKNQDNIICYQICHTNGSVSVEKTMIIQTSDEHPGFDVTLSPNSIPSKTVTATVTKNDSALSPDTQVMYWNTTNDPATVEGSMDLIQVDNNWFFAKNAYGNYSFLRKLASNLYNQKPVVTTSQETGENDCYAIKVSVNLPYNCNISLKFDDGYMLRLGKSGYSKWDNVYTLYNSTWELDGQSTDGIYKLVTSYNADNSYDVYIYGQYLYDSTMGNTVNLGYKVYVEDVVGNTTELSNTLVNVKNVKPTVNLLLENVKKDITLGDKSFGIDAQSVTANFNVPVINVTPLQHYVISSYKFPASKGYTLKKQFLSIFKDGTYEIKYKDIFGNSYSTDCNVSGIQNEMEISTGMAMSESDKFTLATYSVANNKLGHIPTEDEGVRFCILTNYAGPMYGFDETVHEAYKQDDLYFSANGEIIIMMMTHSESGWNIDASKPAIVIGGDLKVLPQPVVSWYYDEFSSNSIPSGETTTDENVVATVTVPFNNGTLQGINGKLLSYTFVYNGPTSYTFEYCDEFGNEGVYVASLPIQIVQSKPQVGIPQQPAYVDNTLPDYFVNLYGNSRLKSQKLGVWKSDSGTDGAKKIISDNEWSKDYTLQFNPLGSSKIKMVLLNSQTTGLTYANATSQTVDGVELNVESIKVKKPVGFTVALINENNLTTFVTIPSDVWGKIDTSIPQVDKITYEPATLTAINALISLKDDKSQPEQLTLLNPTGLNKDSSGRYIIYFDENKTVSVTFMDIAGNINTADVSVSSIDDKDPTANVVWWSEYYADGSTSDITRLTTNKTNKDISVYLAFDKTITKSSAVAYETAVLDASPDEKSNYLIPTDKQADYVKYTYNQDNALLKFIQNATAEVNFAAINSKTGTLTLTVKDIIDKTPPSVTIDVQDRITDIYATVVLKDFSKPVFITGPDENGVKLYNPGDTLTKTFSRCGKYTYTLTDKSGNTTVRDVIIQNIDEYSPGIAFSDMPVSGQYFKNSISFRISMDKAGTISFQGVNATIAAPTDKNTNGTFDNDEFNWATFTVSQNGSYTVCATDLYGRKTITYINFGCFDNISPNVVFSPLTLKIMNTTDVDTLNNLLKTGVNLTDNVTDSAKINYTFTQLTSQQISIVGKTYAVVYTITDLAGNQTTATRYVKVFSANEMNIKINGIIAGAKEMNLISGNTVNLDVYKQPGGTNEPYKVYYKKGIYTSAQMKDATEADDPKTFNIPETDCNYTVYIITQSRGAFLTYLKSNL